MEYSTDGTCLYERVTERVVQNAGVGGRPIRYLIAMDCRTLEMVTLTEDEMRGLRPVVPAGHGEVKQNGR